MTRRTGGRWGDLVDTHGKSLRSTVLFVVGLAGIVYETLVEHTERPTLLILFAGMVGLPAFLKADERREDDPPKQKDHEAS